MYQDLPSAWVRRFAPLIRHGGRVLDLAAGGGRQARLLLDMGYAVTAVDRDVSQLQQFAGTGCVVRELDLEAGDPEAAMAALGHGYAGVIVTNYLHRPLFPGLAAALAPGGVLIYETFAAGTERLLERMWQPVVHVEGPLATLWAPYDFHVDGKRSHCGVDAVTLLRGDAGWRVAGITYTVQRADCAPSPLGPP
jgi:SAM-dependent methyltransferase